MTITDARKKILCGKYGDPSGCILADSWKKAIVDDLTSVSAIYPDDMDFLTKQIGFCYSTPTTPTTNGVLERTETKPTYPTAWVIGRSEWCGSEFKNTGNSDWKGYVGVKITDSGNVVFNWPGDPAYTYTIKPGVVKVLWANVPTPAAMKPGTATVELVLHQVA
jgi:hypothetical protein